MHTWILIFFILLPSACSSQKIQEPVRTGAEILLSDSLQILEGKNIGVICNHTSVLSNGVHLVDTLANLPDCNVVGIFSPEHGYRGKASAGEHVASGQVEAIPLHSLYGNTRKPTAAMLAGIDLLVFDIQDVGSRFYTYMSTMGLCIEAAGEAGIPIIICDRPNPIRGDIVQGPVLQAAFKSFVGMYLVPIRHGLTAGELALMAVAEGWIEAGKVQLRVLAMENWQRSMWYDETGIAWIAPSPNIPNLETALLYSGLCLVEGTTLSEGRGTETPFMTIGAPDLPGEQLAEDLNNQGFDGLRFEAINFVPRTRTGARTPKHENKSCQGVQITLVDRNSINPILVGVTLIAQAHKLRPKAVQCSKYLSTLAGCQLGKKEISSARRLDEMFTDWANQSRRFKKQRTPYLLYK